MGARLHGMKRHNIFSVVLGIFFLVAVLLFFSTAGVTPDAQSSAFHVLPPKGAVASHSLASLELQGANSVQLVPIYLDNDSTPRVNDPTSILFPFPKGMIISSQANINSFIQVLNENGSVIPSYATITSRWDGVPSDATKSVKSVRLDFQSTLSAGESIEYTVKVNPSGGLVASSPTNPISVVSQSLNNIDTFVVSNGLAVFHIPKNGFRLFDSVRVNNQELISSSNQNGLRLVLDSVAEVSDEFLLPGATQFKVNRGDMLNVGENIRFYHYDRVQCPNNICAPAGSNFIYVQHPQSYAAGQSLLIGASPATQETRIIQSVVLGSNGVPTGQLMLSSPLQFTHSKHDTISIQHPTIFTITQKNSNTLTVTPTISFPLTFGMGVEKTAIASTVFTSSSPSVVMQSAVVEDINPLRATIRLHGTFAQDGGSKSLSDVEFEVRYHIYANNTLADVEASIINRGSRGWYNLNLGDGSYPAPEDLLIKEASLGLQLALSPSAAKTISFGSFPNNATTVSDTTTANATYTVQQEWLPGENDIYSRNPSTPVEITPARIKDNGHGSIRKNGTQILYQDLGQLAPNYICASGCLFSQAKDVPIENQPGFRFDNAIGYTDGAKGVAFLPDRRFWENAPNTFKLSNQKIEYFFMPAGYSAGVKRVGQGGDGPFSAEDFLRGQQRLFGGERYTMRQRYVFFANGENVDAQRAKAKAYDYHLYPQNADWIQQSQIFFGIKPYYTHAQLEAMDLGPLDAAKDRAIQQTRVLTDWQQADPNSTSIAAASNDHGGQISFYNYNFDTGKGSGTQSPYGKQRAGSLERADSPDLLAHSNLYEWLTNLMYGILKEDHPHPLLFDWADLMADNMLNNHSTYQARAGKDPDKVLGLTHYERGDQYLYPQGSHWWQEGQTLFGWYTHDALTQQVNQLAYDAYILKNGIPVSLGSPTIPQNCDTGFARTYGWPANNALARYAQHGDPKYLIAAENYLYYLLECTRFSPNEDLGYLFDTSPTQEYRGIGAVWLNEIMYRGVARLLLLKHQAGLLGNDPRDAELLVFLRKAAAFYSYPSPEFSALHIWGAPFFADPQLQNATLEIGNEPDPTNYFKSAGCQMYPNSALYTNPAQTVYTTTGDWRVLLDYGCVNLILYRNSQGPNADSAQDKGARSSDNLTATNTAGMIYYALSQLPNETIPSQLITNTKRLGRDGILYATLPTDDECPYAVPPTPGIQSQGFPTGNVNLNDPRCYGKISGRNSQFISSNFKTMASVLNGFDSFFWLAVHAQDCDGLNGVTCAVSQQCAGQLVSAVGTNGQATCCVQTSGSSPVPQLCVNDVFPPALSNPLPNYGMMLGLQQLPFSIQTNENATCYYTQNLSYSFPSSGTPSIPVMSSTGGMQHSTIITNLPQPGSVTYRIFCRDSAGNVGALNHTLTVLPAGQFPYSITNIQTGTASSSATISWNSSLPTQGQVAYGSSATLGSFSSLTPLGTAHSVTLSNLSPSTIYQFHIQAQDPYTNSVNTSISSFMTQNQQVQVTLQNTFGQLRESSMSSLSSLRSSQIVGLEVGRYASSISASAGKQRALIRFDLSPIPTTLNLDTMDVKLRMKIRASSSGGAESIGVYPITSVLLPGFGNGTGSTAVAGETSWMHRASPQYWSSCGAGLTNAQIDAQCGGEGEYAIGSGVVVSVPAQVGQWVEWDVTPILRAWMQGDYPNHGLLLRAADESLFGTSREFHSANKSPSGNPNDFPKLIIAGETGTSGVAPPASPLICPDEDVTACTIGVCVNGTQSCMNGIWTSCAQPSTPNFQPTEMSCGDNLDNDCDGFADCLDNDCILSGACELPSSCGDNTCNANENCSICTSDCGTCPNLPVFTSTPLSSTGNGGGGGGGGGSGGNSSAGNNQGTTPGGSSSGIIQNGNGLTPTEIQQNPILSFLNGIGSGLVGAFSSDAAESYTTNILAGVVVLILAMGAAAYFMGFI